MNERENQNALPLSWKWKPFAAWLPAEHGPSSAHPPCSPRPCSTQGCWAWPDEVTVEIDGSHFSQALWRDDRWRMSEGERQTAGAGGVYCILNEPVCHGFWHPRHMEPNTAALLDVSK